MANIQIPITKNGKTTLATKGTKNAEDIDINVDISSTIQSLSITPSETSQTFNASNVDGYKPVNVSAIQTETPTVDLSLASGNQTVNASSGKYIKSLTITKPSTMIPSNIKSGVNIGGVVGTYEGSTVSKGLIFKKYNSSGYPTVASFEGGWTDIPESMCSGLFQSNNYFKLITSLTIPNGVNRLGKSAFNSCSSLISITLPDSLTYIDYFAFNACTNLTNLTIPINVKTIKNSALSCGSSENKTTFTFKSTTPPSIGSQVFNTSWINKIYVPSSAVSAYKSATNWSSLSAYIQADPNE